MSNLILGKDVLTGWKIYPLDIDGAITGGWPHSGSKKSVVAPQRELLPGPTFYMGTLQPNGLSWDTFLKLREWTKVIYLTFGTSTSKRWLFLKRRIKRNNCFASFPFLYQGQVWINGVNLGRYWPARGPQQTLYVPGPLLSTSQPNNITVLELERAPAHLRVLFMDRPHLNATAGKSPKTV